MNHTTRTMATKYQRAHACTPPPDCPIHLASGPLSVAPPSRSSLLLSLSSLHARCSRGPKRASAALQKPTHNPRAANSHHPHTHAPTLKTARCIRFTPVPFGLVRPPPAPPLLLLCRPMRQSDEPPYAEQQPTHNPSRRMGRAAAQHRRNGGRHRRVATAEHSRASFPPPTNRSTRTTPWGHRKESISAPPTGWASLKTSTSSTHTHTHTHARTQGHVHARASTKTQRQAREQEAHPRARLLADPRRNPPKRARAAPPPLL